MAGTPVAAPESGTIVAVGDGSAAPFVGYGPWFAVIQGDSGKFHLLGHLDPATSSMGLIGLAVTAGDHLGTTSSANHTHWEVRDKMVPDPGEDNADNNTNPITWLRDASMGALGTVLVVGAAALFLWFVFRD